MPINKKTIAKENKEMQNFGDLKQILKSFKNM